MKFIRALLVALTTLSVVSSVEGKDISTIRPIKSTVNDTIKIGQAGATIQVTANPCSDTHIDYNIRDIVRLSLEPGMLGATGDTSVSVKVQIIDGANQYTKTLYINTLQKASSETYIKEELYKFSGSLNYQVTITEIKVNGQSVNALPLFVSVVGEITSNRIIEFSATETPEFSDGLINTCDGGIKNISINWENITGAEEYQLEWTFVNDYKGFDNQGVMEYFNASELSNLSYDFKNNSTRISTTGLHYQITNIYEHGYLLYRVRGVGRVLNTPDQEIFGLWSNAATSSNVGSVTTGIIHITTVHEGDKNWQYAATYAEEGKKKEVISYFDGSLRNRQSVTKTNTDSTVLVGQTIYDSQGRPAVNVLPVPVSECVNATTSNPIKYYNNFNRNLSNTPYNYTNFENETDPCASAAAPMNTNSGASNYYSPDNLLKERQQAYLPDAQGYPFTQIRYTPDNTGRVTLQSGVGPEFQIGTGREIANYYGQPDQIQLDRMFGCEVGDASHYKKNLVIDANGQASVSYLNQEGKVIATSLAGTSPGGLSALPGMTGTAELKSDLFKKDANGVSTVNEVSNDGNSIVFSTQVLVASSASEYTFDYGLNVTDYKAECMPENMCFSCVYDLQIMVYDECGSIVPDEIYHNTDYSQQKFVGRFQTNENGEVVLNSSCTNNAPFEYNPSQIKVKLDRGVYTVSKVLKLNEKALDYYVKQYLDTNLNINCMNRLSEYQDTAFAGLSLSDCDVTCAECEESLGPRAEWIAQEKGTGMEWDYLYEECGKPCKEPSMCEGSYIMMLSDVSLNGQYGKFTIGSDGVANFDNYSVMNENNLFGTTKNWRNPQITINNLVYNYYVDAYGNPARIRLFQNDNGSWSPTPKSGVPLVADADGKMFINPQDLANITDFVAAWQPSWAKSLVVYHPEYCQYLQCVKNTVSHNSVNITSDEFDRKLLKVTTFKQALSNNNKLIYQDLTGYHLANFSNPSTGNAYDPYAIPNSPYTSQSSMLAYKFSHYINDDNAGGWKNIEQAASYAIRYGSQYGHTTIASDYNNFGIDYINSQDINIKSDKEWNLAKNLYFSEKRKIQEQEAILACGGGYDNAWITAHGKTPRFYGQATIPAEVVSDAGSATSEIFYETGLCPRAFDLMTFLSAMANAGNLTSNAGLDIYPEFSERLYDGIPRGPGTEFSNVKWTVINYSNTQINIKLQSTSLEPSTNVNDYRVLTLTKLSTNPSWSNIEGFEGLGHITANNGVYTFTANARVYNSANQTDPYSYFLISGSTNIDIANCTMPAVSTPNSLSTDLRNLWNALAANGQFQTGVDLTTNYPSYLTHNITSLLSATTNIRWEMSTTPNEYNIYSADNLHKKLVMYINTPAPVNLSALNSFGPLSVNNQEGFDIDALAIDHSVIAQLSGFVYVQNYDGPSVATTTDNISLGHYGLYIPASCSGTPYKLTDDLTHLLKGLSVNRTDFSDVVASKNLTANYYYTTLLGTTLSPTGCKLELSTHLNGEFSSIKITGNVIPCGWVNTDGTYSNFYMLADYLISGVIVHDTLFGSSSCLHINRCLCPEITETDLKPDWRTETFESGEDIGIIINKITQESGFGVGFPALNSTINHGNLIFSGSDRQIYQKTFTVNGPAEELDFELTPFLKAYVFVNNQLIAKVENRCDRPFKTFRFKGYGQYLHIGSDNKLTILLERFEQSCVSNWWRKYYGEEILHGLFNGVIRSAVPCNTDFDTTHRPHYYVPEGNACEDQLTATALSNAQNAYKEYLSNLTTQITEQYRSHCMHSLQESFTDDYPNQEYHFTLYYYDQAGNLIKTIPPEGVELLDITSTTSPLEIQANLDRTNGTHTLFTTHRMETRYEYNSLNQLVKQVTPDQDKMNIWELKLPSKLPATLNITATQFVNANKGYLAGNIGARGVVYETNTGGDTWSKVNDLVASDLKKIQMIDGTNTGYAVGSKGVVLKSMDYGASWDMLGTYESTSPIIEDINDLYFDNAATGVIVGTNGKSYYTTNGGTFTEMSGLPVTANVNAVTKFGTLYYAAIATSEGTGDVYTADLSVATPSWTILNHNLHSKSLAKVEYSNSKWNAVGAQGTLMTSADGISWQVMASQTPQNISDIHYFTDLVCIALIDDQNQMKQLMKSADGGKTWSALGTASQRYNSIYSNSATGAFAVGKQGVISQILYSTITHTVGITPINEPQANFTDEISAIHASDNGYNIWIATTNKIYYGTRSINDFNFTWINASRTSVGYKKCYADYANNVVLLLKTDGKIVKATYVAGTSPSIIVDQNDYASDIIDMAVTSSNLVAIKSTGAVSYTPLNPIAASLTNVTTTPNTITDAVSLAGNGTNLIMVGSNGNIYKTTFDTQSIDWSDNSANITPLPINDLYSTTDKIYAVGDYGSMYIYENSQWLPISTATIAKLTSVKATASELWITGVDGTLLEIGSTTINPIETATNKTIYEVAFNADYSKGYAVGANGTVFYMEKTDDIWNVLPASGSGTKDWNYEGLAIMGTEAILVGSRSIIYRQDGAQGLKNNRVYTPQIKSLSFANTLNGYVVGNNGLIRHTTDGGATWSIVLPTIVSPLNVMNTVCATSADNAFIGGDAGYLVSVSGNSLTTPVSISALNGENINAIKTNGSITCIAANGGKAVWKPNTSSTWTALGNGTGNLRAIHLFRNDALMIVGSNSFIGTYRRYNADGTLNTNYTLVTLDKNLSGIIPAGKQLNDVYFHDDRNGYVVGNGGAVYKCKLDNDAFEGPIRWIAKTLEDDYGINNINATNVNITTIAFPSRYNGFMGGNISNNNGYARTLHDESELYSTFFWYDRLGRMIVSRNKKQESKNAYSYTLYDQLGRIKEVGEIAEPTSTLKKFYTIFGDYVNNLYNPIVINDSTFNLWILANTRSQTTRTFYDYPLGNPLLVQENIVQENLRKRVATATYSDIYQTDSTEYDYATHYTYDIHGNVKTLWQDNPKLTGSLAGQRFKRIDYDYDLVSGKVNEVKYQAGQPDQFIHRYEYDADNRIIHVQTSKDGVVFDNDASYTYYKHGPLARVEVGNELVQGVDYAYTLQGWVKGVNSNSLKTDRDMGTDGKPGTVNRNVALDAFGYSLSYYDDYFTTVNGQQVYHYGDYTPIDPGKSQTATNFIAGTDNMSNLATDAPNLYNGNIRSMVTTISDLDPANNITDGTAMPQLTAYRYDQLNRIKGMKAFDGLNIGTNNWAPGSYTGRYQSDFTYDANGNILSLQRKNQAGILFDDFVYKYEQLNQKTVSNRLYHVNDVVAASNQISEVAASNLMSDDIDDQGIFDGTHIKTANNYGYDELGNLKSDKAEGIETIEWTAYGKIKSITRRTDYSKTVNGQPIYPSNLEFRYDPTGNRIAKIEKPRGTDGLEKSSTEWITTYYVRDATGNPMGTYKQSAPSEASSFKLIERPIYGSSRVGIDNTQLELFGYTAPTSGITTYELGHKQYEFSNHLGNVLTTVTDKKIPHITNGTDIDYYMADITSATDYYPFGSPMDGRTYSSEKYRFGFNGKEKDDELKGEGNSLDFGARIYDSRLGRWLALDPLMVKYSSFSPYNYCINNPIKFIDPDGREVVIGGEAKKDYFKEVVKGAKALDVKVKMNKKGILSAKYIGKGPISKEGQLFLDAVNSPTESVKINATNSDYVNGLPFVGGAFMGNSISYNYNGDGTLSPASGEANQTVNPKDLKKMDDYYKKPGQTSLHEITEAYQGIKISYEKGVSSGNSSEPNSVYNKAHNAAIPQSGSLDFYYFNAAGYQVPKTSPDFINIGFYFNKTSIPLKQVKKTP